MTEPHEPAREPKTAELAEVADERMALARLGEAKLLLLVCTNALEVKAIRDQAEALRVWARARGNQQEVERGCADLRIRADRRLGELLPERDYVAGPGRGHRRKVRPEGRPITSKQAHRFRQLASYPEERFEAALAELQQRGVATTYGVLRVLRHDPPAGMTREAHACSLFVAELNQLVPLAVRNGDDVELRPDLREEFRRALPQLLALKHRFAALFRKERSS